MMFRAASLLALVAYVAAQSLVINTPAAVVQCQPAQITWTATNTPVFVSIIPGGQAGAAALQDFGQQSGTSLTWTANIAAGTSITFQLRDSTGAVAYSSPVTIQSSADSSCLGQQPTTAAGTSAPATSAATSAVASTPLSSAVASVSSAASSAVSSVSASVSSVVASATSRATATSPASSTRAATATSATPSASAPANNAAVPNAKVGLAGLLGLAAAVVMA